MLGILLKGMFLSLLSARFPFQFTLLSSSLRIVDRDGEGLHFRSITFPTCWFPYAGSFPGADFQGHSTFRGLHPIFMGSTSHGLLSQFLWRSCKIRLILQPVGLLVRLSSVLFNRASTSGFLHQLPGSYWASWHFVSSWRPAGHVEIFKLPFGVTLALRATDSAFCTLMALWLSAQAL